MIASVQTGGRTWMNEWRLLSVRSRAAMGDGRRGEVEVGGWREEGGAATSGAREAGLRCNR